MQVGPGKGALAGIVSAEAVTLMEEVLTNMMTIKLTLVAATVLVASMVTAGVGVTAYSSELGRDEGSAPAQTAAQKKDASPPPGQGPQSRPSGSFTITNKARQRLLRQSEAQVKALLREYKKKSKASGMPTARRRPTRPARHWRKAQPRQPGVQRQRTLQLAELDPGPTPAEDLSGS